ncbi:VOC family protein [Mycolicibacter senuensis]|uniref:VOC family protein n=1 Tax=Mycolicibacter senuensis TaxID=386913 RepID=UPI00140371C2|nr:VOC family protein [Mycolicibacter senuensis]
MNYANHFHVGILVADITVAIDRFSDVLGVRFTEPAEQITTLHDPDPIECRVRASYSLGEPPYLELVEAQGDGVLSLRHGEGLHHLGYWAPDFETYRDSDAGVKLPAGPRFCLAAGAPTMWLTDPRNLHGVRLELVNSALRDGLEAGLAVGRMSG